MSGFTRSPIDIDLSQDIEVFNAVQRGEAVEAVYGRICAKIDQRFPRIKDGKVVTGSVENRNWTKALILCAWLGWMLESNAIWHEGRRNPEERHLLHVAVIPSIMNAFEQGIAKAISDEAKQGKHP
jgi:hypothetical protein